MTPDPLRARVEALTDEQLRYATKEWPDDSYVCRAAVELLALRASDKRLREALEKSRNVLASALGYKLPERLRPLVDDTYDMTIATLTQPAESGETRGLIPGKKSDDPRQFITSTAMIEASKNAAAEQQKIIDALHSSPTESDVEAARLCWERAYELGEYKASVRLIAAAITRATADGMERERARIESWLNVIVIEPTAKQAILAALREAKP